MTQSKFPQFQWSFSTLGCPLLSLKETCQLASEFGIQHIEARIFEDQINLPKYFSEKYGSAENVNQELEQYDVGISFLDTSLKLIGNDEKSRDEFLQFLPWAEALGVRWLRVFDGGEVKHELDDESLTSALETLEWWRDIRTKNNWKANIAIETHDALSSLISCQTLFDNASDEIDLIWDTHHTWKKAGEPLQPTWQTLRPNTRNVHIKDSISKPSPNHPYTYSMLGDGEFPLEETLEMLEGDNYTGYVTIEWERKWHPYLEDLWTALQTARNRQWI